MTYPLNSILRGTFVDGRPPLWNAQLKCLQIILKQICLIRHKKICLYVHILLFKLLFCFLRR